MSHPNHPDPVLAGPNAPEEAETFADLLSAFEEQRKKPAAQGEPLSGTVIAVSDEFVYFDIGRKMEGVIRCDDLRDPAGTLLVQRGDTLPVSISGHNSEGYYTLSTIRVERPRDYTELEKAFTEKLVVAGTVIEQVKGGLRVDIGLRAFLPASRSGAREQAELEKLVGQEIRCRIIQLDVAKEDAVVDRRAVLEEEESVLKQRAFDALEEGAVVRGTVRGLTDFGAFVDLGSGDGLLHVTDIAWTRIAKPADVLSVGQSVEVKILKVNRQSKKVSLGMKQLVPDPWSLAAEKYVTGARVQGKVVRLADFGAFVELEAGVDGLIHVSELSYTRKIRKPSDVLKAGETVEVQVLGVNSGERRIALGLKQVLGDPWEEAGKRFPVGSVVEGPIGSLANFGAFVDLGDGIEGMIHIGDITAEKRLTHPKEALTAGQTVRAQVLEVDVPKRRIRLGMKQLQPTSADEYIAEHNVGDTVTGRVVEAGPKSAKVELGEGVMGYCRLAEKSSQPGEASAEPKADLSSLTAMLSARWKSGSPGAGASAAGGRFRAGEIGSFRISALDPEKKRIDLEPAG
ncbi:MAG: 30S ribosomal protein S1 [Acidobacteria bacterium]|nr:30S ribosomal protein S1 [Acidobacteriota bacterium]